MDYVSNYNSSSNVNPVSAQSSSSTLSSPFNSLPNIFNNNQNNSINTVPKFSPKIIKQNFSA